MAVLDDALDTTAVAGPEEVVVAEEVVDHEGGHEEGPQQHVLVLALGAVDRVGVVRE